MSNGVSIMNNASKLYEAIKDFSEPALAEVVDFAEFLRQKQLPAQSVADDDSLESLVGGLEDSETFGADALSLQHRIRDEWN
jgi:hypothetical protein